jgi:hypothetical protein
MTMTSFQRVRALVAGAFAVALLAAIVSGATAFTNARAQPQEVTRPVTHLGLVVDLLAARG